jgi:outer membrane autotransporter protein
MSKNTCGVVAAVIAVVMGWSSAQAQTAGEDSCQGFVFGGGEQVLPYNTCAAGLTSYLNTVYVPSVVQRAVANSFGLLSGPPNVEPAGLAGIVAGTAEDRLRASDIAIVPTAAEAATPLWNVWADGRYLHSDYSAAAGGLEGPTLSGMGGFDYKLTQSVTVGVMVSGDNTELDTAGFDVGSGTIGVGPYLGVVLTDNIVLSASLMRSWIDSDQAAGLVQFDTDRVQASAGVTGYWYKDTWRFTPGLSLSWSKDWEEEVSGFLLPDRTIEIGVLTPSLQIGNTWRLSDTTTVEPWLGAALDWTFINETDVSGGATTDDPNTDIRLQAGLNFGFPNGQLAITGEVSGLLLDDLNAYSVAANLAFQF